jgi:two-component system chemotaxis response regulator CheB
VLSGADGDGTLGLDAIKLRGGTTIVKDPAEAAFPSMPDSAIQRVQVDHVLPVNQIPPLLVKLVNERLTEEGTQAAASAGRASGAQQEGAEAPMSTERSRESERGEEDLLPITDEKRDGRASGLTCPDCDGSIWELEDGHLVRFECRVGHRYNPEAFLGAQSARVEDALWTACNVLQERAATLRQFAVRLERSSQLAAEYEQRAHETDQQAESIRAVIMELIRTEDAEDPKTA